MAVILTATKRDQVGKGAARRIRSTGLVPAIIYGDGKDPVKVALDPRQIWKQLQTGKFYSTVYKIDITKDKAEEIIVRDIQFHVVTDQILHADFLRVGDKKDIIVDVPMQFLNQDKSVGIKRGGVLNVVRYKVPVKCKPKNIPDYLEVDLEPFKMGESIHINHVTLPENISIPIERNFTIATIATPRGMSSADEEEAES